MAALPARAELGRESRQFALNQAITRDYINTVQLFRIGFKHKWCKGFRGRIKAPVRPPEASGTKLRISNAILFWWCCVDGIFDSGGDTWQ